MNKYGAILVDPPWAFRTYKRDDAIPQRAEEQHYPAMPLDEMMLLPVAEWAAPDCALFMWYVDAHLVQALQLAEVWGFTFKTANVFIWDKAKMGMGFWARKEAECVNLFTRGRPKRLSAGVRQIIRSERREHSRKPDEIYMRIEALVGGPYLEMFARQAHSGWDAWGNETNKFEAA